MSTAYYDIEANGLLDTVDKIHCIVVNVEGDDAHTYYFHDHPELCAASGTVMQGISFLNEFDEIIAHNEIKYDIPAVLKVTGVELTPKVTDTLILSKLLYPDRSPLKGCHSGPHSIEAWGMRLDNKKPEHEDWETFSPAMLHRCAEDVKILVKLHDHLMLEEWGEYPWERSFKVEQLVEKYCLEAELHGWPFDKEAAEGHVVHLTSEMERIYQEVEPQLPFYPKHKGSKLSDKMRSKYVEDLAKATGFTASSCQEYLADMDKAWVRNPFLLSGKPNKQTKDWFQEEADQVWGPFNRIEWEQVNIGSDKQVKTFLLSLGWKPLEWNVSKKTGEVTSPKLTEESLEYLNNPVGLKIAEWIKCRHRRSQLEGWLEALRPDGRVPSVVNALGTPTGRMTHKVIANVPSIDNGAFFAEQMRGVFIAEPGYKLMGCDAKSCQLRMLCHYMQDPDYTEAVLHGRSEDGTDIHSVNMRATGVANRTQAKRFIYGFLFGAGPSKVGRIIGKGPKAGQAMMKRFMDNLPALKNLKDSIEEAWQDRGYLIGLDGRKLFVRKKHELLCYLLQGAEAILMKFALCTLINWIKAEGLDARLVNVYHDEYTFMVKEEQAERLAFLAEQAISAAGNMLGLTVPAAGDAKIGNSWAEIH